MQNIKKEIKGFFNTQTTQFKCLNFTGMGGSLSLEYVRSFTNYTVDSLINATTEIVMRLVMRLK